MQRTHTEKVEARQRNASAALELQVAVNEFRSQLESEDTICLDGDYCDQLVELRSNIADAVRILNPIIDEGIRSISAQSTSGSLVKRKSGECSKEDKAELEGLMDELTTS
jgi:hypothetical protein